MLPPRIVRRLVLAPLVIVLTVVAVLTLPIWLLVVTAASLRLPPPQRRGTRLVWFAMAWLTLESMALCACLWLWVANGLGGRLSRDEYQERHYELIQWLLSKIYEAAVRIFRLSVEIDEPPPTSDEISRRLTRPVIVLSRHAGPGDSFLLVHHLLARYGRRPRIVMKAALQFDPSLDVVINRLPNAFVPRKVAESGVLAEIRRLSSDMDADDALVIFPEGGNFTPKRRWRAILRLEQKGLAEEAARARKLEHLMAPRPNGAIAAIEACPEADVVFVAHTGLDDLVTFGDIWTRLPLSARIKAKWWRIQAADVPRDREEQIRWLFDQWEEIDAWITENQPAPASTA
ncbi:1-acyl-sn-glycerol-3-phosphate acyltransferase [Streptosporangium sp. NBC_01469]|uniref:1-acyl-sn-glycerol-3-phosphate acyltransferase n=1 Tax=Streptosporangium sp. NBC_01469 TaxID=2903898 RepID=UPI002E2D923D|nr:1-acyl-sn-glycerol-3-phosphate acyltransferase [Streptosporangium sp. NBC_01469]